MITKVLLDDKDILTDWLMQSIFDDELVEYSENKLHRVVGFFNGSPIMIEWWYRANTFTVTHELPFNVEDDFNERLKETLPGVCIVSSQDCSDNPNSKNRTHYSLWLDDSK